jgi:tetratricopeptide (TPR) repeat protein
MLFMGQEFLEDKQWSDNFALPQDLLLNWAGLKAGDKEMSDHLRFTSELIALRWRHAGLRGPGFRVVHARDENRVLAFHRWVDGEGHDVLSVAHRSTFNRFGYRIGVQGGGVWGEVFNSDIYESRMNPVWRGTADQFSLTDRPCTDSSNRHLLSCRPIRSWFSLDKISLGEAAPSGRIFLVPKRRESCNRDMTATGSSIQRRVFVVMPFGKKQVPKNPQVDAMPAQVAKKNRLEVDFDAVYRLLFNPAIKAAGLQPFRADDEEAAGDILKDMFAELVTADFVLADISILNANVFYELGIRHTVGPRGVICLHAGWADRPFDVAPQRTFKYDGQLFRVGLRQTAAWQTKVDAEVTRLGKILRKAVAADRTTEGSPVYGNLPNLVPPDARGIGIARFRHYQEQAEDWKQRVKIARKEGRAEDILTLAGDVPSPYHRRDLLYQCAEALLALGRFAQAERIFQDLSRDVAPDDVAEELRVKTQLALLANQLGRRNEAEQKLTDLVNSRAADLETRGFLARVYKDMWRATWSRGESLEDRVALAWRKAGIARKSIATYETALRQDLASYSEGINVVSLTALVDHIAQAYKRTTARDLTDLQTVVRIAATTKLDQPTESVSARATLGQLHLVLGHAQEALDNFEQASADPSLTWFNLHLMFEQVQMFRLLGYQPESVEPVIALLEQRLEEAPHPSTPFAKVIVCSGHMIDAPGRKTPRFPKEKAEAVREKIAQQLERWEIGENDLAVSGGACGADTLFAEECLRRGAQIRLLLAQELDDFVRDSVRHAGNDWVRRFHILLEKAEVGTQPARLGKEPNDVSIYARTNLWIINTARVEAVNPGKIYALLVWDEKPTGDGPGGTSDFQQKVCHLGGQVEIINPTKLP